MDHSELLSIPGITEKDLALTEAPLKEVMEYLDPIYVSYFVPWNSISNYHFAKSRGFHDLTHDGREPL